jgi:uncharacterized protein YkwD
MNYLENTMDELIQLHNDVRTNKWLWKAKPFKKNNALMQYAQQWANKMAVSDSLRHSDISSIMKGITDDSVWPHRILKYTMAAENIAYGQNSTESVMRTWLNSSGHKKNIMNSKFTDIGCGMSLSINGKPYWCVCFGRI